MPVALNSIPKSEGLIGQKYQMWGYDHLLLLECEDTWLATWEEGVCLSGATSPAFPTSREDAGLWGSHAPHS